MFYGAFRAVRELFLSRFAQLKLRKSRSFTGRDNSSVPDLRVTGGHNARVEE